MFKLGLILLFITFTQIIAVTAAMQILLNRYWEVLNYIHPLTITIIFIELLISGTLMYKGYGKENI